MARMTVELRDAIFDFAYHAAMNDATLQNAYTGEKKVVENNKAAHAVVKRYIDDVLAGNNPDFMETARQVDAAIGDLNFRFGNIQKLISMTAKYIYLGCYADENMKSKFECCPCPMDSLMIKTVRGEYLEWKKYDRSDRLLQIPVGNGKTSTDTSKIAWSKIQFEETDSPQSIKVYVNFEEMVQILAKEKGLSPLEYDFVKWNKE